MISANEARNQSEQNKDNRINSEMERVMFSIERAIKEGKRKCTICKNLSEDTVNKIKENGYGITRYSANNEIDFVITW
jgi:hypothetical protein